MANNSVVVKLDKVKLIELCSDAEIFSCQQLSNKCGLSKTAIAAAFRDNEGRVSPETALRISTVLGKKIDSFGTVVQKTITRNFRVPSGDFAGVKMKKADSLPKDEAVTDAVKDPDTAETKGSVYVHQLQPIMRELKEQTTLATNNRADLGHMSDAIDAILGQVKKQTELLQKLVEALG